MEAQYKIKNHFGAYNDPEEIKRIVKHETEGGALKWTVGKAYLASKPLVRTLQNTPRESSLDLDL